MEWLRKHRRHIYRLSSDLFDLGRALVGIAALMISILAVLAGSGHHPSSNWLLVAGSVGGFGLVLSGLGWVGKRLTRQEYVTSAHAETLRRSAEHLLASLLNEGSKMDYGIGYRPREAFHAHYPDTAAALDEWDAALDAVASSREALDKRIALEIQLVERESEGSLSFSSAVHHAIFAWLMDGALKNEWPAEVLPAGRALYVTREDNETGADYEARADRNLARIKAMANTAPKWPEVQSIAESHKRLAAWGQSTRTTVRESLTHIREHGLIAEAKGCPSCEEEPS